MQPTGAQPSRLQCVGIHVGASGARAFPSSLHRRPALFIATLLCLLIAHVCLGQPTTAPPPLNSHRWGSITVFNGLPSDTIRAIAQTPDGVLWFGTDNGLVRSAGRGIQPIGLGEGDTNKVLALKTDSAGRLWIGTQKGAFVYTAAGIREVGGTGGMAVSSILAGDTITLGTDSGFVLAVSNLESPDAQRLNPQPLTGPEGSPLLVTSVIRAGGRLLIGTHGKGILEYRDGQFSELLFPGRPMFVTSLAAKDDHEIWIGAEANKGQSGIYRYDMSTSRGQRLPGSTAVVLAVEVTGEGVFAGTARYGLFKAAETQPENWTFENTSGGLRSNSIFSIFTDREGVIWFGTNRGLSRYDSRAAFQEPVSDIPNRNFIRTLWRSDEEFLAGSNRGLFISTAGVWKPVPALSERSIYAILRSRNGQIVATPDGTFDLNGHLVVEGETRSLAEYRGRAYGAVSGRGIVDIESKETIFPDPTVNSLYTGSSLLWIGTAGHGLFSYDGRTVKAEATPEQLKSGTIWNIREDKDKNVWIAGQHGVFRMATGQIENVVAAEEVRDVVVDLNEVWAATTTRGVLHARYDERFGWLTSTIGFEQGLPSDKAFVIVKLGDRLLFGTNRGIVTYYPHYNPPMLAITRVLSQRIHDASEFSNKIDLDYPQNSLIIEVAGLSSRTFPEEFQYAFTLRNSRGDTVDHRLSADPQYAPTDLKAGDYVIEVVALDRDLNSSEVLKVRFSVAKAPFPWTATALGVLLLIAMIGLVLAYVEHRRMRQRNRELAAARLDLANEAERERRRIARDLHDQTLADLRNLMMMSDKLSPEHPEFRTEIEAVSGEIRRICEDLSPSVLENVGLVAALEFLTTETIENGKFTAPDDLDERITYPVAAQLQIYRIAQEVLNNIKRHSTADTVEMELTMDAENKLRLMISDNGAVFEPTGPSKGRGIANIKARASLINARVAWKQRRSGGNRFTLTVGT